MTSSPSSSNQQPSPSPSSSLSTNKSPPSTSLNSTDTPQHLKSQSEARTAILASLTNTGSTYDRKYQTLAADIHANARSIAQQESDVKKNASELAKQSDKWAKEMDRQMKGLNEFGDLQNWAEVLENEFLVLEETLRLVEHEPEGESASGGSQWKE